MNISKTVLFCLVIVLCTASFCVKTVDYKRTGNAVVVRMESDADRLNTILTQTNYGRIPSDLAHLNLMTYNDSLELVPYQIGRAHV